MKGCYRAMKKEEYIVDNLNKTDLEGLKGLLHFSYRYIAQYYGDISLDEYVEFAANEISQSRIGLNEVITLKQGEQIKGLLVMEFCKWDTEYFGVSTGKIIYLLSEENGQESIEIKKKLLNAVLEKCLLKGIKVLSSRIGLEDFSSLYALEEMDFRMLTTEAVFVTAKKDRHIFQNFPKANAVNARLFRQEDYAQVENIGRDISSSLISHYSFDRNLSFDKCKNYYIEVVKNCCLKDAGYVVFVAENGLKVIGCMIYKIDNFIGMKRAFCTLMGVLKSEKRKGVGSSFMAISHERILQDVDLLYGRVYLHNIPMLNTVVKVFQNSLVGYQYYFKKWLK